MAVVPKDPYKGHERLKNGSRQGDLLLFLNMYLCEQGFLACVIALSKIKSYIRGVKSFDAVGHIYALRSYVGWTILHIIIQLIFSLLFIHSTATQRIIHCKH